MRRIRKGLLALSLVGTVAAVPGVASADGEPLPHGHILVLGVEFGPEGVTYRKCVDVANNQALPLHAHHEGLHTGRAGDALREHPGHFPIPTAPYGPFENCEDLAKLFGPPTK
ncbi:MAG TPA: hypothetical protein VGW38_15315 [Chloroflexota bacterium]|nr:hypothetical protein [Chloroflexota bacterium]